jgi:hypothetical protein
MDTQIVFVYKIYYEINIGYLWFCTTFFVLILSQIVITATQGFVGKFLPGTNSDLIQIDFL